MSEKKAFLLIDWLKIEGKKTPGKLRDAEVFPRDINEILRIGLLSNI